jgi:TPR repeat protein
MTDSIYTIDDNPGYMYRNGYGVEQNYEEAVKWYRLAEEQGHTDAGKRIAKLIELGYVAD